MADETTPRVQVSREIAAPAEKLFALLTRSANHPRIDGSGMVREAPADVALAGVGVVFDMHMHHREWGDYEMTNLVVEYEPDRRIGWEPSPKASADPDSQGQVAESGRYRWSFELEPLGPGRTLVTEIFDCSRSPEDLREAVKGGAVWVDAMTASLERLDELACG
jgi:uncharacterized protein YndB with AHSA1/START domain